MIKLDILSDPICPWCFIGKTLLDRALAERPAHPFAIEYHPFQLNPDMPAEGMDRRTYLETKFGGKEEAVKVYARIAEAGEAAGLMLNLASIERTPSTIDAHRLIHWAGMESKQIEVVQALFEAYFLEGRDIGDRDVLADIADSAGMDAAAIRRTLDTEADKDEISARDSHSRERGVTGVPTHVIAEQHVVPGAQQPELWVKLIDEVTGQLQPKQ